MIILTADIFTNGKLNHIKCYIIALIMLTVTLISCTSRPASEEFYSNIFYRRLYSGPALPKEKTAILLGEITKFDGVSPVPSKYLKSYPTGMKLPLYPTGEILYFPSDPVSYYYILPGNHIVESGYIETVKYLLMKRAMWFSSGNIHFEAKPKHIYKVGGTNNGWTVRDVTNEKEIQWYFESIQLDKFLQIANEEPEGGIPLDHPVWHRYSTLYGTQQFGSNNK